MVMEHKDWPKSWNFAISHGIFNFAPRFVPTLSVFATTKKVSINVESRHFPTFSTKRCECKINKRDGKVMEKYFAKSVGTLQVLLLGVHAKAVLPVW